MRTKELGVEAATASAAVVANDVYYIKHTNTELLVANTQFSRCFIEEYLQMCAQYDTIAIDLFAGEQLEQLINKFLAKHENYLKQFEFTASSGKFSRRNFAFCSNTELAEEDLRIVQSACNEDKFDGLETLQKYSAEILARWTREQHNQRRDHILLADVYRRACQACHLRSQFNKARRKQQDDERDQVLFARHAIRYDPNNFYSCYWFMIAIGSYLDSTNNPFEQTVLANLFKQSSIRCIKMNESDMLSHHLLGRYYFQVAKLSWIERTVVKKMTAIDLSGSVEDAEREFMLANQLNGQWLPNGLWLAKCMVARKQPIEQIKKWIDFGIECACIDPTSEVERVELLELQSKLKLTNKQTKSTTNKQAS